MSRMGSTSTLSLQFTIFDLLRTITKEMRKRR
jgi:hypothetical protein